MTVGILGAGQMGQTLAKLFLAGGHDVVLANSRGPASLATLMAELGRGACSGTREEVLRHGAVVVIATRWDQTPAAIRGLGPLDGKVMIDTTNNLLGPGDFVDIGGRTSSEVVADLVPGARLVKAFNHQPIPALNELRPGGSERRALFLAGDDAEAKRVVASLMRDIGGEPMDAGSLREGGKFMGAGGPLTSPSLLGVDQARERLDRLTGLARAT